MGFHSKFLFIKGYTMIEMLVVILIIVVLATIMALYSVGSRQQIALYTEESKISQIILRAKSSAISTFADPNILPSQRICGYGIHIDYSQSLYSLFSYVVPSTSNCSFTDIDLAAENILSSYNLDKNLVFASGPNRLDNVLFIPPAPKTFVTLDGNSNLISNGIGNIYVSTRDGAGTITITVSSAGQISFQ